jgi:hypothetical protein
MAHHDDMLFSIVSESREKEHLPNVAPRFHGRPCPDSERRTFCGTVIDEGFRHDVHSKHRKSPIGLPHLGFQWYVRGSGVGRVATTKPAPEITVAMALLVPSRGG